jgi:hypothetical protein
LTQLSAYPPAAGSLGHQITSPESKETLKHLASLKNVSMNALKKVIPRVKAASWKNVSPDKDNSFCGI